MQHIPYAAFMRQNLLAKLKKFNNLPYIIMLVMALILAQIAPYDTASITNFFLRAAYWGSIIFISQLAWKILEKILVARLKWPYFFIGSLCNLLMTFPLLLFILFINQFIYDNQPNLEQMFYFWLQLAITCQSIYLLIYIIVSQFIKTGVKNADDCPPENIPHFLKNIAGDLLYIKSEDHYLRIQTTAENKLILYKISDAIKQLETSNIEGMSIHRSHWVAKSAIKNHKKDGRKNLLMLVNDHQLPISATYLKNLKNQGYI